MGINLYDSNNIIFDEPVEYKSVKMYPVTVANYMGFHELADVLTKNAVSEKDVSLIGLPYLDYIYKKAESTSDYSDKDNLMHILSLVFKNDKISIDEDINGNVTFNVFTKSKEYDKFENDYNELVDEYKKCIKVDKDSKVAKLIAENIEKLLMVIFDIHSFNSNEFDKIKEIICEQNDIGDEIIDPKWENILKEAKKMKNNISDNIDSPDFRDLLLALSFELKKTPSELKNMSISTFDRYITIMFKKETFDYDCEVASKVVKPKKTLKHWLVHYTPKGKYDDVVSSRSDSNLDALK